MIALKCKMCGGDIDIIEGKNIAKCEYCGSMMTLPSVSDEKLLNLFDRANHYRLQNDFEKALAIYENIVAEDNNNAEAHWGCVLSKYGIEYVEDPKTHRRIPTCHRLQYELVSTDFDYRKAVENAPDIQSRQLYIQEAAEIAEIQKKILAVARNEEPYDVFICYKETDDKGQRTIDSTIAQDIYDRLIEKDYKVFFSRITLEDKLGTLYEPYIFSAINSSKVMLVVGTKKENFEAIWVKNEWTRFLELAKKDSSKLLIPCYKDMSAYDLPDELAMFQSQDMGKIGFIQDLIHGINKIINQEPKKEQEEKNNEVVVNNYADQRQIKFENLLINAHRAIDAQNWGSVERYYAVLQEEYPKDSVIETTFFTNFVRIRRTSLILDNDWRNVFSLIERYYDMSNENKEEIFDLISNCLYKLAFPKEEISMNSFNRGYYRGLIMLKESLERIAANHNEEYIHKLISQLTQMEMIFQSKKNKYIIISVVVCIMAVCMGAFPEWVLAIAIMVFLFGVLPYLIIKKISSFLKKIFSKN